MLLRSLCHFIGQSTRGSLAHVRAQPVHDGAWVSMSADSIPRRRGKQLVVRRRGGQQTQAGEFEQIAAAQRSRRVEPLEVITHDVPPLLSPSVLDGQRGE